MKETAKTTHTKAGLPPGTLIHVGKAHEERSTITLVNYSHSLVSEIIVDSVDEIIPYCQDRDSITWVNIEGLQDIALIDAIGSHFNIHPLVLEDIVNTHQRPKFEDYDDYLFMVLKALLVDDDKFAVTYEQISLVVFKNVIFSFKEKRDELFSPIRHRLANGNGRFRTLGADYLAYTLIDCIVDEYFQPQDRLDNLIEKIEDELLTNPERRLLFMIQTIRRELVYLRRIISPMRELLAALIRSESHLIDQKSGLYFRDVYDHTIRVLESQESYRELITGLLDIYLSSTSNRMNEIMKVLTIFAAIFIPLTFIAGIYGMNFDYMPELRWKWAYPALWFIFIGVAITLLIYFKKKKWL